MRKPMGEFASLVQLWNPKQDLSRACGIPDQNAIKWYQRDSIPAEYWPEVMAAFRALPERPRHKNGKPIRLTERELLAMYVRRWR